MPALLHHLALIKHIYNISVLNRAQTVRNSDCSATLRSHVQRGLYDALGCGIECRGSFVEEEDFGVAEEGAGDGDALALAAGEEGAFCADEGVEGVGEGHLLGALVGAEKERW